LFFTIGGVAYTVSSYLVTTIDNKVRSKRNIIKLGLLLTIFSNLLTGPSKLLGLPDSQVIIAIG